MRPCVSSHAAQRCVKKKLILVLIFLSRMARDHSLVYCSSLSCSISAGSAALLHQRPRHATLWATARLCERHIDPPITSRFIGPFVQVHAWKKRAASERQRPEVYFQGNQLRVVITHMKAASHERVSSGKRHCQIQEELQRRAHHKACAQAAGQAARWSS